MKFKPAFGMKNRHIQTLYSTFFKNTSQPKVDIEEFTLSDGDFIEPFWYKKPSPSKPIVILFHGLSLAGSYNSPYIKGIMKSLSKAGFNSVLMHFRSCSGRMNKLPRTYHSGETGDAKEFIKSVKQRFPHAKIFGVGYSLGGNMLLKLLGEETKYTLLDGAVSVSAPMQLDICANEINKGFSLFYQWHLIKALKKSLIQKYSLHDMKSLIGVDIKDVKKIKTFWEFDEVYVARVHGFNSAQDYYTKSSAKQYLKDISTPSLIIHALDDPFMNEKILPNKKEISPHIKLDISQHGGHVGFIGGTFLRPKYYLEDKIVTFLKELK